MSYVPPSNTGLKKQWGVGDPTSPTAPGAGAPNAPNAPKAGSDKQAQDFQAAFEKAQGAINGHLQYTATNAEESKHGTLAGRRDAMYAAYQAALGKIDRTDPSKAQAAIDKVLGDAQALGGEVATFRQAAEKARNDWEARQGKYDEAVHQVEELETWEDAKAPALRGLVDGIRTQTNVRRYAEACVTLDSLLPKLAPIYADYLKQREAKPRYEQQLAELTARLAPLKAAERPSQPMTAKVGEADAGLQQAATPAANKDYVSACEELGHAKTAIDELEKLANDPQRQQYLTASQGVEQSSTPSPDPSFKSLDAEWQAIDETAAKAAPLADAGDYAGANQALADVKLKREQFQAKLDALKQAKAEFDTLWQGLQPRIAAASQSTSPSMATLTQEITQGASAVEAAATAEDFAQAATMAKSLAGRVDEYDAQQAKLTERRQAYETALAALEPRLAEAHAAPVYKSLAPMLQEFVTLRAAMEAAAQADDFDTAIKHAADIDGKVTLYLQEVAKQRKFEDDFKAAWAPVKAKLGEALLSSRAFAAIDADRQALVTGQTGVEAAAAAGDFENGAKLIPDLDKKADAYLVQAKAKEDAAKKKGDDITKQLDGASDVTRGDVAKAAAAALGEEEIKSLPTPVRNRLLAEMQKGGLTDDEKNACKNLFSQKYLDPKFEKLDDANREKLIEKMKQDPDFKKARDNWATITEAERVAVLKKAASYQAEVYNIPVTDVVAYSPKNPDGTLRLQRNGEYSHADGKLKISREAMQTKGFDSVMDTVVHENGHRYQATLVEKLNKKPPEIKPGDPEYDQAMTFAANEKYYVQPKTYSTDAPTPNTGNEYFTQPQETHSRRMGEGVAAAGIGK